MEQLPSLYQEFIHLSRYSRWLPDKGRRETWEETVRRYFDFFEEHLKETCDYEVPARQRKELEQAVLNLEIMPSMRALMTAGEALKRENVAGYNCSYVAVDSPRAFDEILYVLMNGTGVGFSVERQHIAKLPVVADEFYPSDTTIVVADSKLGWAKALKELISLLYTGQIPKWDLSRVRPAGSPLKTFGGRASGPEPLEDLFWFCVKIFQEAAGRKLQSLECHDIVCKIAEIVVVGGVRRSALISLSNLSDERMRGAKAGEWHKHEKQRSLSNNSACYTEKPDMGIFMAEWKALYDSKSGERGIFNRISAQNQAEKFGRRDPDHEFGTNPCCVVGKTPILTSGGYSKIVDVVGKEVSIWNGFEWCKVTPFYAGKSEIIRIHLSNGSFLDCSPNHKFVLKGHRIKGTTPIQYNQVFVEAQNLKIGDKLNKYDMPIVDIGENYNVDPYSQGFHSGDGKTWTHGKMFPKTFVPVNGNITYKLNWLAGLIDSDGCLTKDKNGNGCQITSIDLEFLNNVRLLLTTIGVNSKIQMMHDERVVSFKTDKKYRSKTVYRLMIGNMDCYHLYNIGLKTERVALSGRKPNRNASRFVCVADIQFLNKCDDVYCFTEQTNHTGTFNGVVTGQSEIILRSKEFCNLSEIVVRAEDDIDDLKRKVKLATILGTWQSTLINFKYLTKEWKRNCEEERLLGVSLTGIMDNVFLNGQESYDSLPDPSILEELRDCAVSTNKRVAKDLDIEQAAAVTCIKPSGTVSQLVNCASGIHSRHSQYYIRTVRADNKDPLCQLMKDLGFPNEPDFMKPNYTTVFSFPVKSPDRAIFRKDKTAIEQLRLWLHYQRHWCEHKPSVTISVKEDEWMEVGAFVYEYFDEMSGVSFLPYSDHIYRQAPYQDCSKEEYDELCSKMPSDVDWEKLSKYEEKDNTVSSQSYACSGQHCEIVDLSSEER